MNTSESSESQTDDGSQTESKKELETLMGSQPKQNKKMETLNGSQLESKKKKNTLMRSQAEPKKEPLSKKELETQETLTGTQPEQEKQPETLMEALKQATNEEKPKSVLWIVALLTALFIYGIYDFTIFTEENGCAMTYMYEYPMFVHVKGVSEELGPKFPRYRLLAYGEGEDYLKSAGDGIFTGIPVLFIPGNAGSFKQVRSMASVALRKAYDKSVLFKYHFNYFTIDYDEEYSALYGGSLEEQSSFAAESVKQILRVYEKSPMTNKPSSVVIIGHSIGGIVAKSMFTRPGFDPATVSTIITLATPHKPVALPDWHMKSFYQDVDSYWNQSRKNALKDVTLVSIGGGERDIQVRSELTFAQEADVNVITTHSPSTWVSTDHQCIAWCKQLMLSLNRALFDSVDQNYQITKKAHLRKKIFHYHLVKRNAGKKYKGKSRFPATMLFDKNGIWSDSVKRQFSFESKFVDKDTHHLVKILDDPKHEMLTVDAINFDYNSWVFGCKALDIYNNVKYCKEGDNLSDQSYIIPSNGKRKTVTIDLKAIGLEKGYTHILILIPKQSENVKFSVDVYRKSDREISYEMPRWITFWKKSLVLPKTVDKAVFYNLSLTSLDLPWQAYEIHVTPVKGLCDSKTHFGLMQLITPWANDARQSLIGFNMSNQLTAKLQHVRPVVKDGEDGKVYPNPFVLFTLNPECNYKIELRPAIGEMWGQMVRFYGLMIIPFCIAATFLTLVQQIKDFEKEDHFPSFVSVISAKVTPVSVVLPSRLLGSLLSMSALAQIIPTNDYNILADQGIDFTVLPIILFFVSIGFMTVIAMAAWVTVIVFGTVANKALTKFVASYTAGSEIVADVAISGISRFPFILSGVFIALASATCGSLSLCLGTFCQFIHLFHLYAAYLKDFIKDLVVSDLENRKKKLLSSINFQFTISLLWTLVSVLNAPSLLAWTKGLAFSPKLEPDPSLFVSIVLSGSLAVTWGHDKPQRQANHYKQLATGLQFVTIIIVLFGCVSLYRLNWLISAGFVLLSLHQIFSQQKTEVLLTRDVASDTENSREESSNAAASHSKTD